MKKHQTHRPHPMWDHDEALPDWARKWHRRRGPLFFRLIISFGFILLLVLAALATVTFLFIMIFGGDGNTAVLVWTVGCGLALALPLLAAAVAARAFSGVATPLAEVMAAADGVAEGDLSARVHVPARGPKDFGRLAESFNHMAEELERADQQRRNLTADVAHELRTPLHIIQGNLEGILDGVYEPTEPHIVATLEETRTLARLVEDLRTLSLAEAGQLPLIREPVPVAELLADVRTSFSGQAEAAGITLYTELDGVEIDASGDWPDCAVLGDAGRLNQVLANLTGNALRHTPAGGSISLLATSFTDRVRIVVRDTGEGIPAEQLPYIFDRFWRGDRSRSRGHGAGSGLGLAIARQLVQAHGGKITAASQPGQETTFTIELPGQTKHEGRQYVEAQRFGW